MTNGTPPTIVVKNVKHIFSTEEKLSLGSELARAHSALRGLEAEFDQIKAGHKAKLTASEARIDCLGTDIQNGFDMRNKECRMTFDLAKKRRLFFLAEAPADAAPVADEPMDAADFQAELLQAEAKFNHRSEIELFPRTGSDNGTLIVGEIGERWYCALRIQIGTNKLQERLDSEQKNYKTRADAVKLGVKRANDWIKGAMGEQVWKGFAEKLKAAEALEIEKVE